MSDYDKGLYAPLCSDFKKEVPVDTVTKWYYLNQELKLKINRIINGACKMEDIQNLVNNIGELIKIIDMAKYSFFI